jgi:pentatricopeptide repeat protein
MMSGLLDLHETNRAPIDGCLLLFHSALSSSQPAGSNNSNGRCENNNHKMLSDLNWNRLLWRLLLREKRPREAWLILQQMRTRGIQLSFPWKS